MQKIRLHDANALDLRRYASEVLGIDAKEIAKDNVRTLLSKIKATGFDAEFIELTTAAVQPAATPMPVANAPGEYNAVVIIHENEDAGGKDAVPLSVNGRAMYVERGKEQTIRKPYYEVLKNARRALHNERGDVTGSVQMYPFSLVRIDKTGPDVEPATKDAA